MTRTTKIISCLILVGFALYGCVSIPPKLQAGDVRAQNAENLLKLRIEMSRQETLSIMGTGVFETYYPKYGYDVFVGWYVESWIPSMKISNPYRTESKRFGEQSFEVLYYYTDIKKRDNAITEDELTPLVLRDGQLIGWGRSFFEATVKKFELQIRER